LWDFRLVVVPRGFRACPPAGGDVFSRHRADNGAVEGSGNAGGGRAVGGRADWRLVVALPVSAVRERLAAAVRPILAGLLHARVRWPGGTSSLGRVGQAGRDFAGSRQSRRYGTHGGRWSTAASNRRGKRAGRVRAARSVCRLHQRRSAGWLGGVNLFFFGFVAVVVVRGGPGESNRWSTSSLPGVPRSTGRGSSRGRRGAS